MTSGLKMKGEALMENQPQEDKQVNDNMAEEGRGQDLVQDLDRQPLQKKPSWGPFFVYIAIILLAFLAFFPSKYQQSVQVIAIAELEGFSPFMVSLISLVQPLVLSILALLAGHFFAYKLNLTSTVYTYFQSPKRAWNQFTLSLKPALISGAIYGITIVLFEVLMRPFLPAVFSQPIQGPNAISLLGNIFYGGIIEEILLRFGMMTLFLYILTFKGNHMSRGKVIFIIIFQALIFAFGHYPATSAAFDMTAMIWIRLFLLNGLGGILFGWLYYRYNLESAMVSHMTTHLAAGILTAVLAVMGV